MGLSCKVCGKYESMFKKLDNKLKADREALKKGSTSEKKSKKSSVQSSNN